MLSAFAERATSWRGWCLVLAGVAAAEAAGLVWATRTPPLRPTAANAAPAFPTAPGNAASAPTAAAEDAAAIQPAKPFRALAAATRGPRRHARELEDLGATLAGSDPEAAFRTLAGLGAKADRVAMLRGMFETLAQGDPARALAYAKQTAPGAEREAALTALLGRWSSAADESPEDRAGRIDRYGLDAGLGLALLQGDPPRPDLAVLWAEQLASRQGRVQLLGQAAAVQAASDPALAASYGSGLSGKDQITFDNLLVSAWTRAQPEAAWQWSSALDDPAAREQAQCASVVALSGQDPQAASARLALLPDDDLRRDALREVAISYAGQNTDAALAWAQTLPPADQAIAAAGIADVTPVGIGAVLHLDAEGYPVVDTVLPNAAASQSGLVHPGDRIVGISQGDGAFVDVQQLDLGQVVNLVRGTPGSVVLLQVAPALPGGGFSAPTVVSVVRQPVKHG